MPDRSAFGQYRTPNGPQRSGEPGPNLGPTPPDSARPRATSPDTMTALTCGIRAQRDTVRRNPAAWHAEGQRIRCPPARLTEAIRTTAVRHHTGRSARAAGSSHRISSLVISPDPTVDSIGNGHGEGITRGWRPRFRGAGLGRLQANGAGAVHHAVVPGPARASCAAWPSA